MILSVLSVADVERKREVVPLWVRKLYLCTLVRVDEMILCLIRREKQIESPSLSLFHFCFSELTISSSRLGRHSAFVELWSTRRHADFLFFFAWYHSRARLLFLAWLYDNAFHREDVWKGWRKKKNTPPCLRDREEDIHTFLWSFPLFLDEKQGQVTSRYSCI